MSIILKKLKFQPFYVMLTLKLNGVGTLCIDIILLAEHDRILYYASV